MRWVTGASTIAEVLLANAGSGAGQLVFHLGDGPAPLRTDELAERAERAARRLTALGVRPGDAVGVLGPNRPEWVVWAFATWLVGAALVPIQIPLRIRDPSAFADQLARLVEAGDCRLVLVDPALARLLPDGVGVPWHEDGDASAERLVGPKPGDAAVIQFTSGSTAAPKGALLTHGAVMAQMDILRHFRYRDGAARRAVCWAPFFHDLGLFSSVVHPIVAGSTSHNLATERFARDPAEWLRLAQHHEAALTIGPSSAFAAAVKAVLRRGDPVDLSSLDVVLFAAEPFDSQLADQISTAAPRLRLSPEALGSTYGLAETVLGVALSPVGAGLRIDRISLDRLVEEGVAAPADGAEPTRTMVSAGFPVPEMELKIVGPKGDLPERRVGEIWVRGPSMMSGYVGANVPDPFADAWLRTGDLGYMADGELYVTGRIKDLVIAMGHNYYPEDFEWAAGRHPGVRPGRCVAFSKPGDHAIVVLVEPKAGVDADELQRGVRAEVLNAVGVAPGDVVVLTPGTVEKTTSGKLRRAAMRDAYVAGGLT